jgi:hypothetical protein
MHYLHVPEGVPRGGGRCYSAAARLCFPGSNGAIFENRRIGFEGVVARASLNAEPVFHDGLPEGLRILVRYQ